MLIAGAKPTALCGPPGNALNGIECRTVRAALGLERRSVAAWANLRFHAPKPVTAADITSWERSKGRGYPQDLVEDLARLEMGVQQMAERMYADAVDKRTHLILRRPMGGRRILAMLDLGNVGLILTEDQLAALDSADGAREIWQALADAATVRAALEAARQYDLHPQIEMDRQPDEAISPADNPPAQSAPPAEILDLARKAAALTVDRVDELAQVETTMRQIIADGEVTADDLRWLTDLAPGLVQLAANNMKGPRQGMRTPRLRGMVLEGLVSAEAFCAAILRAAPDIERDHAAWLERKPGRNPKA